jgi:hypothetical protein
VYWLSIFSSLQATYEGAIFPYLQKQGITIGSTHIIVVTQHIIRYAYENVNFSLFTICHHKFT